MIDITTFKPLNQRVLVKVDSAIDVIKGGIVVSTASKEKPTTGVVVKVFGKDGDYSASTDDKIKVGDTVMYLKQAGSTIQIDEDEYKVLDLKDILGTFQHLPEEEENIDVPKLLQGFIQSNGLKSA